MPEEINRIIGDHISDYLCAPTEVSKKNLLTEGIEEWRIQVTGNTIVDAVNMMLPKIKNMKNSFSGDYILMTMHRSERVDSKSILKEILIGTQQIHETFEIPIIWPIHPRASKRIKEFSLEKLTEKIKIINPLGYLDFLKLMSESKMVLTDSGGLQEESCTLKIPCVTIGKKTERVETLEIGSNTLAGIDSNGLVEATKKMINVKNNWKNPYGDGKAAKKIVNFVLNLEEPK